jgi:hypothetical protein
MAEVEIIDRKVYMDGKEFFELDDALMKALAGNMIILQMNLTMKKAGML